MDRLAVLGKEILVVYALQISVVAYSDTQRAGFAFAFW